MKTSKPDWTICIATVPARAWHFKQLLKILLPQVDKADGRVEVLVFFNNFEHSLGYLRQKCLENARGKYINHIDDDDTVPDDYVATILPLLDGVDYIGHKVMLFDLGKPMKPVYHTLKHQEWTEDGDGYYRGVTHLNPTRTELARQSSFPAQYYVGEDAQWAMGMRGICKTEHFIDRFMYTYFHAGDESVAYKYAGDGVAEQVMPEGYSNEPHAIPVRPKFKSKNVRFHPESTPNAKNSTV